MRILHLLATGLYSGAENVALTIMAALPDHEMVYASPDGPIRQVVKDRGQRYYALSGVTVRSVRRAVKELRPDIIHAHDPRMSCLAALAAPVGVKIISHLHNDPDWLKSWNVNTLSYHLCAGRFRTIAAVSDSVREKMILSRRFRKKWETVPNCMDANRIRALSKGPGEAADILAVGRLSEQKDPLRFLKLLQLLKQEGVRFRAAMVGDGELREQCRKAVEEMDLTDRVQLAGFRDNPYGWMNRARVLVMPSKWEGFGLVAVEALWLGLPVVCSGVGGLKDIVDDSCGYVCTTDEEYVRSIRRLLEDEQLYCQKSEAAHRRGEMYSDMALYCSCLDRLYRR